MTTLSEYRKKPVVIQAAQWFANGDHPDDYAEGKTYEPVTDGDVANVP